MLAWLGLLLLLISAWSCGKAIVPSSWFGKREERAIVSIATGLALLSNAILGIGCLGLLYPATVLALLLAPILLFGIRSFRRKGEPPLPRPRHIPGPASYRWIQRTTLGAVAILCGLNLLEALHIDLCPDFYHVTFARSFLNNHRIEFVPGSIISAYPKTVEMLFVVGVLFDPESGCSVIHAAFLPLSCFTLYALFRYRGGVVIACLGALWLVGQVMLHKYATMGFVDLGGVFFASVALIPLLRFTERLHLRDACLAGFFAGMAVGCKITIGFVVVFPCCAALAVAALSRRGRCARRAWRGALLFGLVALAAYSPWMIRNAIHTGSPFAPALTGTFPLRPEFEKAVTGFHNTHPVFLQRFLDRPLWSLHYFMEQIAVDGASTALLLPFSVAAAIVWAAWKRSRKMAVLAIVAAMGFLGYAIVGPTRSSRFALPLMPFFSASAAVLSGWIVDRLRTSWQVPFFALFAVATSAVVLNGVERYRGEYLHRPYFLQSSRKRLLEEVDHTFPRTRVLNHLLTSRDRIAFHKAGVRFRHLRVPFGASTYWGPTHAQFLWLQAQQSHPEDATAEFHRLLESCGITYLMLRKQDRDIPREILQKIQEWEDASLFEVK